MVGPDLAAGAVVQNPAVLVDPGALARSGRTLWIDLAELIRTSLGQPEELLYTDRQPSESSADALPPLVRNLLVDLVEAVDPSLLGTRLTSNAVTAATAMYDIGIRRFSSSVAQAEELRLVFGQHALKETYSG
jgi:hypothetical protein